MGKKSTRRGGKARTANSKRKKTSQRGMNQPNGAAQLKMYQERREEKSPGQEMQRRGKEESNQKVGRPENSQPREERLN